ncbi:MAG TPA: hypothetical protein ENI12_04235 [Nitrospirae bacterium]|nr:hypothetical protein [Nitrospirota bacterium]
MDAVAMIPILAAIHVVSILMWIGGVGFVTVVVFPMLMRMDDTLEMVLMFHRLENRFAGHARVYLVIVGITGFMLLWLQGRFSGLFSMNNFGILVMMFAWFFYLFVLTFEKKIFAKVFGKPEEMDGKKVFRFLTGFHWVVLGVSLLAVAAGVWQGHGG